MKLTQIIRESFFNVMRNKLRTGLTMLGLVIGIASVILLVGMGDGSNQQVNSRLQALGGDIVSVFAYETALDYDDVKAIRKSPTVQAVSPTKSLSVGVSSGQEKLRQASVTAVDNQYLEARNLKLKEGRNLSIIDLQNKSKVCLISSKLAEKAFNSQEVVGKTINLDGDAYTVVGVMQSQGENMGLNTDNIVAIPLTCAPNFGSDLTFSEAYVKATNSENVDETKRAIVQTLQREKGDTSNYVVNTQNELLNAGTSVNDTLALLLGGIAGISLIVAGLGVMNVMLVSVAERVREIGIKKALGARRIDILGQFLVESLIMSMLGGTFGIATGLGLGFAATHINIAFVPSTYIVLVAAFTSIGIGLIFGLVPAYRAAKLNPIDALR